jgi:hypothetical protein
MRNSDILAYNNQNKKLTTPKLCKMQNGEVQVLKVNFKWVTLCDQFDKLFCSKKNKHETKDLQLAKLKTDY